MLKKLIVKYVLDLNIISTNTFQMVNKGNINIIHIKH